MNKRMERLEKEVAELKEKVADGTTTDSESIARFQASRKSPTEFHFVRI